MYAGGGGVAFFFFLFLIARFSHIHANLSRKGFLHEYRRAEESNIIPVGCWVSLWKFGSNIKRRKPQKYTPKTEAGRCRASKCLPGNPSYLNRKSRATPISRELRFVHAAWMKLRSSLLTVEILPLRARLAGSEVSVAFSDPCSFFLSLLVSFSHWLLYPSAIWLLNSEQG